jgi:hypothetical protein
MITKPIIFGVFFSACIVAAAPIAAYATDNYSDSVRKGEITSGRSNEGPGGLTARDVVGKHLLDSEGNLIGTIEKVSPDGQTATVRPGSGKPISEDMAVLSLGMGANTVIKQSASEADTLNAQNAAAAALRNAELNAQSKAVTTTETTHYAPSTVTTSTTTVERTQN